MNSIKPSELCTNERQKIIIILVVDCVSNSLQNIFKEINAHHLKDLRKNIFEILMHFFLGVFSFMLSFQCWFAKALGLNLIGGDISMAKQRFIYFIFFVFNFILVFPGYSLNLDSLLPDEQNTVKVFHDSSPKVVYVHRLATVTNPSFEKMQVKDGAGSGQSR